MDGIHIGDLRGADHLRNVEVAFAAARRPNANRLISEADMKRIAVRLGINRDSGNAQFLAGANNPQGDLPAIGDKDFLEHGAVCRLLLPARTDTKERLPVFDGLSILNKDAYHFARLVRLDFVHELHGFHNTKRLARLDKRSDLYKRLRARAGRAVEGSDNRRFHQVLIFGRTRFSRPGTPRASRNSPSLIPRTGNNDLWGCQRTRRRHHDSRRRLAQTDVQIPTRVLKLLEIVFSHKLQKLLNLLDFRIGKRPIRF